MLGAVQGAAGHRTEEAWGLLSRLPAGKAATITTPLKVDTRRNTSIFKSEKWLIQWGLWASQASCDELNTDLTLTPRRNTDW